MAAATINVPHASIVQAITKTMIYRTCPECNGKLTMVFANSSGKRAPNEFYCKKCRQYATTFKTSYRLQLTVVNTIDNSVENLIAFDEAVMPLMGCPASEFDELALEHPDLYDITETFLVGMSCELEIRDVIRVIKVGHLKPDRIVDLITPLHPYAPVTSSTMTCRYWQDNSIDDILESNTKANHLLCFMNTRGKKRTIDSST